MNAKRLFAGIVVAVLVFVVSAIITGATGNVAYVQSGVLRSMVYVALFLRDLGSRRRKICLLIMTLDMAFGAVVAEGYHNQGWVFGFIFVGVVESLVYLWVSSASGPTGGSRKRHSFSRTKSLEPEVKR